MKSKTPTRRRAPLKANGKLPPVLARSTTSPNDLSTQGGGSYAPTRSMSSSCFAHRASCKCAWCGCARWSLSDTAFLRHRTSCDPCTASSSPQARTALGCVRRRRHRNARRCCDGLAWRSSNHSVRYERTNVKPAGGESLPTGFTHLKAKRSATYQGRSSR